jgi:hypothetical protein
MTDSPAAAGRAGSPFWPLQQAVVKHTLDVLRRALAAMVSANGGLAALPEPTLNRKLRRHLVEQALGRTPRMAVIPEGAVFGDQVDGAYSEEKTGEPDFQFSFTDTFDDPAKWLTLECKRVSGVRAGDHAADHANTGVLRFVEGTYSRKHAWALMAGYVFEGGVSQAVEFVANYMAANADRLRVTDVLDAAPGMGPDVHASRHRQTNTGVLIRLLHYFASIH